VSARDASELQLAILSFSAWPPIRFGALSLPRRLAALGSPPGGGLLNLSIAAPELRAWSARAKPLLRLLRTARLVTAVVHPPARDHHGRELRTAVPLFDAPLPPHRSNCGGGGSSAPPTGTGGAGVVSSVSCVLIDFGAAGRPLIRLSGHRTVPDGTPPDLPLERPD
jgi:hypothetical protein